MNAAYVSPLDQRDAFINLVDFKWLMAGVGWWVDLTQLQRDNAYLNKCLRRALRSGSALLEQYSAQLLGVQPIVPSLVSRATETDQSSEDSCPLRLPRA